MLLGNWSTRSTPSIRVSISYLNLIFAIHATFFFIILCRKTINKFVPFAIKRTMIPPKQENAVGLQPC